MADLLAEYFVIIGFDHQKQRGGLSIGKVIQGFPQKEWSKSPFVDSIATFCQPQNWRLSNQQQQPSFFMFVLTDEFAAQHYCGCFVFHESVAGHPMKQDDEDIDDESLNSMDMSYSSFLGSNSMAKGGNFYQYSKNNYVHQIMYAPKCLLLISRHNYPEILKNCLTIIYTVYIENVNVKMECLVTNLLACIEVPPPGSSPISFSLGAGDRQILQPPLSSTIPVTSTCVYELFNQLGIYASINVVFALMTENKILVLSRSYTQIYNACHAFVSLIYPFVYSHIYIPILPSSLLDFIASPTPYLMGIHSSLKNQAYDTLDVIIVDLDEGSVKIPDGIILTKFDENLYAQLINHLCLVLRPKLAQADHAFSTSQFQQSSPQVLDKEIRAIFLRIFTQLLQGYRSCLTVSRIYPKPIITFNKTSFLSQRNYINNEFVNRLLDCIFFSTFVQERGIPYRSCDLFDDLYSSLHNYIKEEIKNSDLIWKHIKDLANQINLNENPNFSSSTNFNSQSKIPLPTEGAFLRIHLPNFPLLDSDLIKELCENERIKRELPSIDTHNKPTKSSTQIPRIVPMGLPMPLYNEMIGMQNIMSNSARRLEVMKKCVNSIFENKIHDARKTLNAVMRALQSKNARLALCEELNNHVMGNKAILEHEQFDLVVRLMNCVLQDNSDIDMNEVAAAIVPLAMKFCRRLTTNVIQFAYTCIQDHSIWSSLQFWEQTFYLDVEKDIKNLYCNSNQNIEKLEVDISKNFSEFILKDSALEIAAQQMRIYNKLERNKIEEFSKQENATIYAQAIHYANIIVSFKVPFDISNRNSLVSSKNLVEDLDANSISNFTNQSNAFEESITNDNESGFEEDSNACLNHHSSSEIANSVIKFIYRFIDKVCNESEIIEDSIKQLHNLVPSVVSMQIESLEPVWRESRHLPPLPKPKILFPHTLPGEEFTINELRAYLINDGKDESRIGFIGGTQFLPADGAIFLTNYRIIFKGRPNDPFASESIIVRSFPIASIIKEKRINIPPISSLDQYLPEGLQIKSNTFQMMKIAFDEEVSVDQIESFRKTLIKERTPVTIFHHFAFTSQLGVLHTKQLFQRKNKEKKTIQVMAKKTLLRTAEKAGFKTKNFKNKNKNFQNPNSFYTMLNSSSSTNSKYFSEEKNDSENVSNSIDNLGTSSVSNHTILETKSLHRLHEMLYVKDYERLGFSNYSSLYLVSVAGAKLSKTQNPGIPNDHYRISSVNMHYSVCRTYPGMIVVPNRVSDEMIKKISRCYRQGRFPAIVWRHPRNKALILRSSAPHNKGMIGLFKNQTGNSNLSNSNTAQIFSGTNFNFETQIEHENFIKVLANLSMTNSRNSYIQRLSDIESSSVNSFSNSPESYKKYLPTFGEKSNGIFNRNSNTLRTSGGKSNIGHTMTRQFQKWSNSAIGKDYRKNSISGAASNPIKNKNSPLLSDFNESSNLFTSPNSSISSSSLNATPSPLYIIGEKNNVRFIKPNDQNISYEFIPIEIHEVRHLKSSFKKILKICVPSDFKNSDSTFSTTFLKDFLSTDWLKQIQTIMEIASLIVELVDVRGSSVMLSLEDGSDLVPQIVSVAELCLDPYYRTFEGFRTLIEKEWLAFGHRFTHRSNLTAASMSSGFAPLFLQFLDIVHQIHSQFPLSFEFNQYYIKFVAYHYVSCRFRTFLQDCEFDRCECGWIENDIKLNLSLKRMMTEDDDENTDSNEEEISVSKNNNAQGLVSNTSNKSNSNVNKNSQAVLNCTGTSFWNYCTRIWVKSPIFHNFYYVPIISIEESFTDAAVLRPLSTVPSLKIWEYYVGEELAHGPSYDLEIMQMERHWHDEEMEVNNNNEKTETCRIIVNSTYDSVDHVLPNCFILLLDQIKLLEGELNCTSHKWMKIWSKIEIPITIDIESVLINQQNRRKRLQEIKSPSFKTNSFSLDPVTSYSIGLLNSNQLSKVNYISPHNFEFYTSPMAKCSYCALLIGVANGGYKCTICEVICHENCKQFLAKPCNHTLRNSKVHSTVGSSLNYNMQCDDNCSSGNLKENTQKENFSKSKSEDKGDSDSEIESMEMHRNDRTLTGKNHSRKDNGTFKGYLHKKGAFLKSWKQRWFVLDTTQHQLRYYESDRDSSYKGYIDLSEVVSVVSTSDPFMFELQLTKRLYNFMAPDENTAQEWIERISACLQ